MANRSNRTILAGATASLLVVGAAGAAIGANLALPETAEGTVLERLGVVTARAELEPAGTEQPVPTDDAGDDATTAPVAEDTTAGDDLTDSDDTAPGAGAAPADDQPVAQPTPVLEADPAEISASEAIAIAEATVGGALVEIERSVEGGRAVYEVERRLTDGRSFEVTIAAADGTVLAIEQEEDTPVTTPVGDGTLIGVDAAVAATIAEVGGTFVEAELEREGGSLFYEVELRGADGVVREVAVDAATGAVLRIEEDDDRDDRDEDMDDRDEERAWDGTIKTISSDAAVEAARAAVGDAVLVEVERDEERGRPVWEVEVRVDGRSFEVTVDASTGSVLEVKEDD